jgi:hypothetical protein
VNTSAARMTGHLALAGMLGACLLAGCSSIKWHKVPRDASAGFYQSASLTYRLDAGKLQLPLDVARVEGQSVSYEQVASSPLPDQSIGTLSLTYPHPTGRVGYAQAKFTLESTHAKSTPQTSWNPFKKTPPGSQSPVSFSGAQPEVHEVWVLDVPSVESDQYFKLLSTYNFFNTERPTAGDAAQLTVTLNGGEVHKNWDQIAELNALVQRVRREGRLAAYARPDALAGSQGRTISSTQVYSELLARSGTPQAPTTPTSLAPSAFSMVPPASPAEAVARLPAAAH